MNVLTGARELVQVFISLAVGRIEQADVASMFLNGRSDGFIEAGRTDAGSPSHPLTLSYRASVIAVLDV
jgi:hypothetical protein